MGLVDLALFLSVVLTLGRYSTIIIIINNKIIIIFPKLVIIIRLLVLNFTKIIKLILN